MTAAKKTAPADINISAFNGHGEVGIYIGHRAGEEAFLELDHDHKSGCCGVRDLAIIEIPLSVVLATLEEYRTLLKQEEADDEAC